MRNQRPINIQVNTKTSALPFLFILLVVSASLDLSAEEPTLVGGEPIVYIDSKNNSGSAQVLRQYIQAWEDAQPADRARIESDYEEELLDHLRSRTWNALGQAWLLCNQIRENIFPETITEAIETQAVHVETTAVKPARDRLVNLEARFNLENLNTPAAKEAFTRVWDFGPVGKEEGWSISHFFRKEKEAEYSVSFRDSAGKMVKINHISKRRKV